MKKSSDTASRTEKSPKLSPPEHKQPQLPAADSDPGSPFPSSISAIKPERAGKMLLHTAEGLPLYTFSTPLHKYGIRRLPLSQSEESFEKSALQSYFWGIVSNRHNALRSLLLGLISMPSITIRLQIIMYVLRQIGLKNPL